MSLPPIPANLLATEVSIIARTGEGSYGPTWGAPATAKCYWKEGFKKIVNANGEEVVASVKCTFPPTVSIHPGDALELDGERYEAIDVQKSRPFGTVHHIDVYLQSAKQ